MALSSISKPQVAADTPFARQLGGRIRAARLARGLSQADVGQPFTRAYISLVESGHSLPSLPALFHIAERLGVEPCSLLGSVAAGASAGYTPRYASDPPLRRPADR